MPKNKDITPEVQSDFVICSQCGTEIERVAQPGQTLQPTGVFVCDQCADDNNYHAYRAEMVDMEDEEKPEVPMIASRFSFLKVKAQEAKKRIEARKKAEEPKLEEPTAGQEE